MAANTTSGPSKPANAFAPRTRRWGYGRPKSPVMVHPRCHPRAGGDPGLWALMFVALDSRLRGNDPMRTLASQSEPPPALIRSSSVHVGGVICRSGHTLGAPYEIQCPCDSARLA